MPYWTLTTSKVPAKGCYKNFFDTDPPTPLLSFSKGEGFISELIGAVRTIEIGFYKLRFAFGYNIAGRTDIHYYSEPVLIYNGDPDG